MRSDGSGVRETVFSTGDGSITALDFGGTSTPCLLLHGLGGSALDWERLAPFLDRHLRLVAMDLRSHGRTVSSAPFTVDSCIADIDVLLDRLQWHEPLLIGHSLGGDIAIAYASRRRRCRAVVSIDGHLGDVAEFVHLQGSSVPDFEQLGALLARREFSGDEAAVERWVEVAAARGYGGAERLRRRFRFEGHGFRRHPTADEEVAATRAMFDQRLVEDLANLACPLLYVGARGERAGGEVATRARAHQATAARSFCALQVEWIDSSHFIQFDEPGALAEHILHFVESVRAPRIAEARDGPER